MKIALPELNDTPRQIQSPDGLLHLHSQQLFNYWSSLTGDDGGDFRKFDLIDIPDIVPWCYYIKVGANLEAAEVKMMGSQLVDRLSIDYSGDSAIERGRQSPRSSVIVSLGWNTIRPGLLDLYDRNCQTRTTSSVNNLPYRLLTFPIRLLASWA